MNDHVFTDIIEAYEADEETAMHLMINCDSGKFKRDTSGGWDFEPND